MRPRASVSLREKSQISQDLQRKIRGENRRFNFTGILGANFAGQERKHKSSSNTVLKASVLVSSDKKNIL